VVRRLVLDSHFYMLLIREIVSLFCSLKSYVVKRGR
jgi:hypothetical protein